MLTLNDGRTELWQWDTGRTLAVDVDCSQVHFSNKVFGRSIDVDVVDGTAIIPDVLLQTDNDMNVWAFVGTAENGYTKISKTFKVNRRNKPADYVFTPPDQTTLAELSGRLDRIEESQDPDAIKNAVEDYLAQNPVKIPVQSVNGQTGAVELTAEDVGAIAVETDPTVPEWAKQPTKPTYTASEVGALPATYTPPDQTAEQVGADPVGTAAEAVSVHNTNNESHADIRLLIDGLTTRLNALANSTDEDLDQMAELVAYIKNNKSLIDSITTSKVNVSDIVNNLTTDISNKPLSAAQGVVIKTLIDALRNDKLDAAELTNAVNTALAQAKASGEFDGADGKSAYAYAVEGGYTGTESEFAAKLAKEKFANPNALTFTGAVTGSYDGSAPLTVEIPSGGGGDGLSAFEKIGTIDLSTMAASSLGVEYTVTDVTEVVLVWTGMTNTTTNVSSLIMQFNDDTSRYNTFSPKTGKAGSPLNGYSYLKVLEGVGLLPIVSQGAVTNTNYALVANGGTSPYNLIPVKEKIRTLKIGQPATQYYADAGIVEVYVR